MPVVTLPSQRRFDALPGESILDAALRAGVTLEHSCKTGRCSTCKATVGSGQTLALHAEIGLTADERLAGAILTCVRAAQTDIALDVSDLGDVRLPAARTHPCRIQALHLLAPDVLSVRLRLPPAARLQALPGQYIDVIGPEGVRRSYSLANADADESGVELHIRQVGGGRLSAHWFGPAQINDLLRLHGPLGSFFLRDVAGLDLVCLATGTGMAPIKAMLEGLHRGPADAQPASITIYWGGRTAQDLYWDPAALGLPLRYVPVLSRADVSWAGARGHVQDALLCDGADWARTAVYACGSDAMIHGARQALLAAGLGARRFHADAFVCSAPV